MIKNLIFDVGGVLFDYRWKEMFMDYGLDEDNAIRVGTQMFNDPDRTWDIFDLGIKSDEEITDIFCKKYPLQHVNYLTYAVDLQVIFKTDGLWNPLYFIQSDPQYLPLQNGFLRFRNYQPGSLPHSGKGMLEVSVPGGYF